MKIIVIGGSSGLGYEVAQRFGDLGHDVTTLSRRGTGPIGCKNFVYDIDRGEMHPLFASADLIIISAGKGAFHGPHQITPEVMQSLIDTNLKGPLLVANRVIRAWRHLKHKGRIVFVTSTAGDGPAHGLGIYAACKKGIEGFVRAEGPHNEKYGIDLIALSMGWFESPMTDNIDPGVRANAEKHCPEGRFATLDEAARWATQYCVFTEASKVYRFWTLD